MTEGVATSLISAVASVVAVLLSGGMSIVVVLVSRSVKRVKEDTEVARSQLENDHVQDPSKTTNLRENIDKNHRESTTRLTAVERGMGEVVQILTDTVARVGRHDQQWMELTGPHPGRHRKG